MILGATSSVFQMPHYSLMSQTHLCYCLCTCPVLEERRSMFGALELWVWILALELLSSLFLRVFIYDENDKTLQGWSEE